MKIMLRMRNETRRDARALAIMMVASGTESRHCSPPHPALTYLSAPVSSLQSLTTMADEIF